MRDQEQEYPKHQPGRVTHDHHDPFAPDVQEEGELEPRGHPVHQREVATTPEIPYGHARKALIVGLIAGILYEVGRVVITLTYADTYREGTKYLLTDMPTSLSLTLTGLGALGYLIGIVFFFLGGLLIGRIAVLRRWAFIGGFVGGVLCAIISSLLQQIPSYPSATHTGFSGGFVGISGGLIVLLIYSLILCLITGGLTWVGAWLSTRRHPYYVGYSG